MFWFELAAATDAKLDNVSGNYKENHKIKQMKDKSEIKKDWFEHNQTKSVIIYTILIIGATWAFYKFTYEEKKIDFYKAQIESKESEISQYKARIEILEKQNQKLEVLLKEFEDWNSKSNDPGLFYKNKLEETAELKQKYEKIIALNNTGSNIANAGQTNPIQKISLPLDIVVYKSKTYINDELELVIAVNDVNVYDECDLTISFGNKKNEIYKKIKVGKTFSFVNDKRKINLTVSSTQYIGSYVDFHITD